MDPERLGNLLQSAHSAYETADDANAWHLLRRFELIGFLIGGTLGAWLAYEWLGDIEEIGKLGALIGASLSFVVVGSVTKWLVKLLGKLLPWLLVIGILSGIIYFFK